MDSFIDEIVERLEHELDVTGDLFRKLLDMSTHPDAIALHDQVMDMAAGSLKLTELISEARRSGRMTETGPVKIQLLNYALQGFVPYVFHLKDDVNYGAVVNALDGIRGEFYTGASYEGVLFDPKNPDNWMKLDPNSKENKELVLLVKPKYEEFIISSDDDPEQREIKLRYAKDRAVRKVEQDLGYRVANLKRKENADNGFIAYSIEVRNKLGLHARTSAEIVKACQDYQGKVRINNYPSMGDSGEEVSGASILSLMTLAAVKGSKLTVKFQTGYDGHREAMEKISRALAPNAL